MIFWHNESVFDRGIHDYVPNIVLPIIHLLSLYVTAVMIVFYLYKYNHKVRFIELFLCILIIAIWSSIIFGAIKRDLRKRDFHIVSPSATVSVHGPAGEQ